MVVTHDNYEQHLRDEEFNKLEVEKGIRRLKYVFPDADYSQFEYFPKEFTGIRELRTEYRSLSLNIACVKGTKFYDLLKDNDLIEKYMPKWYRDGPF